MKAKEYLSRIENLNVFKELNNKRIYDLERSGNKHELELCKNALNNIVIEQDALLDIFKYMTTPECVKIFIDKHYNKLNFKEIANKLNYSTEMVYYYYNKGLVELDDILNRQNNYD